MRREYDAPYGRQQIRKRWQITVPRAIREHLHLFIGQVLNFDLAENETGQTEIRVYTGELRRAGDLAAYQTPSGRKRLKKRGQSCGKKIRKSDVKEAIRILLKLGGSMPEIGEP
jgi:bifunctional DNA-binding transcriptional regulator/antitoxin component of YhaV-PrlF toxin-antitoxin module